MRRVKRSYFLLVSGNRTGSTWLEMSLNALPDVSASLEMQWTDRAPSNLHVAMQASGFDLIRTLDRIAKRRRVAGSKLVLPGQDDVMNLQGIGAALPEQVRIVHLSRRYIDSFMSRLRNGGHLRNPGATQENHPWLAENFRETVFAGDEKIAIDLHDAERNFERRLAYDQQLTLIGNNGRPYMFVDYQELAAKFTAIARHVGSQSSDEELSHVVADPPTRKLPPIRYADYVSNFEELVILGEAYEQRRREILPVP